MSYDQTVEFRDQRFYRGGAPWYAIATDYHYFRDRREHWQDRLTKFRELGCEIVTFYTPWRHHLQYVDGRPIFDFTGETKTNRDLAGFLEVLKGSGLYGIIKPGPFVHSELNVGGLPDAVCPDFSKEIPPARRHHGGPAIWTYDATQLPAPFDEGYDALVREYLSAVGNLARPYATGGKGPIIGVQLNDETIFCNSNDPPWNYGYEPSGMRYYHGLLQQRYGTIERYNELHGTSYPTFAFVAGPKLRIQGTPQEDPSYREFGPASYVGWRKRAYEPSPGPKSQQDLLSYIDWAEYQWRQRTDIYVRYKEYFGLDVVHLSNYAGITPVIEQNVPDLKEDAQEAVPRDFTHAYSEWWFAMNRVDQDAAAGAYEYGLISWLGVAAYDEVVFDRFYNTARRRRGINMEENWGFAALYDVRSKEPIIPCFQTLLCMAAGSTGYDIYVGANTEYWDDTLDRTTKLQCNTFPSHAPIDEHGKPGPLYDIAKRLNAWTGANGKALLECDMHTDVAYLLYAPYAAVSCWVPDERYWGLAGRQIPRCGYQGCEPFSHSLQQAGYAVAFFELEAVTAEQMQECRALAIHSAFFMDAEAQQRLADFINVGGRLFISGDLPEVDLTWQPCTILKEAVDAASARSDSTVVYQQENMFADGNFADVVAAAGLQPEVRYSENMRAYVHRSEASTFVFFFNFDVAGSHEKFVAFDGQRLELTLGSKTCGVVRIADSQMTSWIVKGANEVEGVTDTIRLTLGDQTIEETGDFSNNG
ncbi:MAG: beta-galactosidase [Pirellulales bacterium]